MKKAFRGFNWHWPVLLLLLASPILLAQGSVTIIGSFEQDLPSYWTKGSEPSGSTLTWASDQAFVLSKSLKIVKDASTEAAKWTSENMCDNWTPKIGANSEFDLGAHIKTEGINTNPTTDDQKWWLSYKFYNQAAGLIGETTIDIDQTAATADWTDYLEKVILPEDAYTVIVEFIGGKDATGTVWADAFKWPASWNRTLELPTGWFNWFPWAGNNVSNGYENTRITTEESHIGLHSLKFDLPFDRVQGDAFVGSRRIWLNGSGFVANNRMVIENNTSSISEVKPGDIVRISVWIKAKNLVPDSAAKYPNSWSVGFTPLMFKGAGNNDGYDDIKTFGPDLFFKFPNVTSFDWTEYYEDVQIPLDGMSKALEVRIHPYSAFTGTIYFDDLSLKVIAPATDVTDKLIPTTFELSQNFPNPFNPSTVISYSLPANSFVTLVIYDLLGREVKTLINNEQNSGTYNVQWNGENNYGSKVSSGLYIYTIRSGQFNESRKMVLLK